MRHAKSAAAVSSSDGTTGGDYRARAALLDGKAPNFARFLVHRKLFGPCPCSETATELVGPKASPPTAAGGARDALVTGVEGTVGARLRDLFSPTRWRFERRLLRRFGAIA